MKTEDIFQHTSTISFVMCVLLIFGHCVLFFPYSVYADSHFLWAVGQKPQFCVARDEGKETWRNYSIYWRAHDGTLLEIGWKVTVLDSGLISWSVFFPMKSLFTKEIYNNFLLGGTFFWGLCPVFKQKKRKGEKENQSSFNFLQNYKLGPAWKYEHSIKWTWILWFGNKNKVNHMESHTQPVQLGSIWPDCVTFSHWPLGSLKWLLGPGWVFP